MTMANQGHVTVLLAVLFAYRARKRSLFRKVDHSPATCWIGSGTPERAMTKDPAFARRIYRLTTIGWFVLVLTHLGTYLAAFLRAGPTDEVYANSISFQILAFCLTVLPYWLLLLLTVLMIEFATLGRLRKPKDPS
jgi:uncharacterized membrane protein